MRSTPFILQSLDPTSYATSWGVLGALVFVIVLMGAIIYQIFSKGEANRKERDQVLMGFVDTHRKETHLTLQQIADTISAAHKDGSATVSKAIENQSKALENLGQDQRRMFRALDNMFESSRFLDRVKEMKKQGIDLSDSDIEKILRAITHERNMDNTRS